MLAVVGLWLCGGGVLVNGPREEGGVLSSGRETGWLCSDSRSISARLIESCDAMEWNCSSVLSDCWGRMEEEEEGRKEQRRMNRGEVKLKEAEAHAACL